MTAKRISFILMGVLVVYLLIACSQAVRLIQSGEMFAIGLGIAILILPLIGAWVLYRELQFGMYVERMAKVLETEGALPLKDVGGKSAGGYDEAAADAAFAKVREQTQADPNDWRAWFNVAASYDAARDRKRARAAMYHAVELFRGEQDRANAN